MTASPAARDRAQESVADIVVVGGGGSALAAAAEAASLGCRVTVLEKNPILGGSTRLATGLVMAVGSPLQERAAIDDSPERYDADAAEVMRSQKLADDPGLRRLLAANSGETMKFLASIGVEFFGPLAFPPFTARRFHQTIPDGRALVRRLEARCRSLGVEFRMRTRARRLLIEDGRVAGVEVQIHEGARQSVFARSAVILATGDFSANRELRAKYGTPDLEPLEAYNAFATGDGHLMAQEAGATIVTPGRFALPLGTIALPRPGRRRGPSRLPAHALAARAARLALDWLPARLVSAFVLRRAMRDLPLDPSLFAEGAILVNRAGKRFAEETRVTASDIGAQPRSEAFVVLDDRLATLFNSPPHHLAAVPGVAPAYLRDYRRLRPDAFHQARSLAALAARAGIGRLALAATVDAHNRALPIADKAIVRPPYVALGPLWACVRHIPIGVDVNARLQVLGTSDEPIPGLYAAGDVGHGRFVELGHGQALAWALTSGRLAGRHAARERAAQARAPS